MPIPTKRNTIQNFVPAIKNGAALSDKFPLMFVGTLTVANSTLDAVSFGTAAAPSSLMARKDGALAVIHGVSYNVQGTGSSCVVALYKNGVIVPGSSVTLVPTGTTGTQTGSADLRDAMQGSGIAMIQGDVLTLGLVSVTGGNVTFIKASVGAGVYGLSV
jgi:hypothetical protein